LVEAVERGLPERFCDEVTDDLLLVSLWVGIHVSNFLKESLLELTYVG